MFFIFFPPHKKIEILPTHIGTFAKPHKPTHDTSFAKEPISHRSKKRMKI
jgi:hypothetical protein